MSEIRVEHPELNIRTTMVLLLSQYAAGVIPAPLAVRMAPAHLLEEAWRAAAIAHLNGQGVAHETTRRKEREADTYAELNEELDWIDARERRG